MSRVGGGRGVVAAPAGLARKTLTGWGLFAFAVSASAPMTVLAGGIVAVFASTGVVGVPAAFIVLTAALLLFSVGYVSMARHLPHAGPLYAHVARGLGPARGLAAAGIALLSYNAIQVCLYGLLGASLSGLLGGAWWLWAVAAWAAVATLGVAHVRVSAGVLACLLTAEIAVVVAFDAAALLDPAQQRLDFSPFAPSSLSAGGLGGALALCVACFVGYESVLAFAEESRTHRGVAGACFGSLLFLGALYTVSAWAWTAATGPDQVVASTRSSGPQVVFDVLGDHYGSLGVVLSAAAGLFLATSILAAMISFHQTVARYLFVLAREGLLPPRFGRVGRGSGVPVGGSLLQSVLGLSAIVVCAAAGVDPVAVLFTQLAALAALGVMVLMLASCLATIGFYRKGGGGHESAWTRIVAPLAGAAAMALVVVVTVANLHSLTGAAPGSLGVWLLPGVIAAAGLCGLVWGLVLRLRRAGLADGVGLGETEPLAELEPHLTGVDI